MPKLILLLFAIGMLGACQQAPVLDDDSPRSRIALGSTLVLHEPLTVAPGQARVFLQHGEVRAKTALDIYSPHCNFELRTLSDGPQTIRPGRFIVTDISWNEEMVVEYGPARAVPTLSMNGGDGGVVSITRLLHHRLEAAQQPELMRLTCHGGFNDPWYATFPSVNQIRAALGAWVSIEPPAMASQRLILQLAEGCDLGDPYYLQALGEATGTRLTLLRELGGDKAVVGVVDLAGGGELRARLHAHPDILAVEPDRLAAPQ